MSRSFDRAEWIALGDRYHEVDPDDFAAVLGDVREIVMAKEAQAAILARFARVPQVKSGGKA